MIHLAYSLKMLNVLYLMCIKNKQLYKEKGWEHMQFKNSAGAAILVYQSEMIFTS